MIIEIRQGRKNISFHRMLFICKNISMERFSDWLLKELQRRNMSQSDLAHVAKLGSGTISNIMNGTKGIGQNTLIKIAHGLNLPETEVFRAAGILPPARDDLSDQQRLANHLVAQTDEQTLELVIAMMETAIRQQQQREAASKRLTPAKSLK